MANNKQESECSDPLEVLGSIKKRHIYIARTFVRHSDNEHNRNLYENLEMRRLGLPTKFTNTKMKNNYNKSKKRRSHQEQTRQRKRNFQNYNRFHVTDMSTEENWVADDETEQDQLTNQNVEDVDAMVEDVDTMAEDVDAMVEEFPSMVLRDNQFDCHEDLQQFPLASMDVGSNENNNQHPTEIDNHSCTMAYSTTEEENDDEENFRMVPKKKRDRLNNYWRQRFILFSRYNRGIKMDNQSWYSVTPEPIAEHIAERVQNVMAARYPPGRRFVVMDPFCGPGGNVIQFALKPLIELVYAIDIDPQKIEMARHNARIYECEHKIEFIVGDFFQITEHHRFRNVVDVCFYSSPWGGPNYRKLKKFSLNHMEPNGFKIICHTSKYLTKNVVMLLPRNFDEQELQTVSNIVYNVDQHGPCINSQMVELERNLVFDKVKTMTAYFSETIDNISIGIPP